jgi:catalase-peroxidase
MRGGANGSRIRLAPQKDWEVNKPLQLSKILGIYETISSDSGASIADIIVLGGNIGIEMATGSKVPFTPGRGDATQEQTDAESFGVLEPHSDGFRNFHKSGINISPEEMMLDKAQLLNLTAPEMTVLVGGMRSLGISSSEHGIFSEDLDTMTNDYFDTLLDMSVEWKPNGTGNSYEAFNRSSGKKVRTATRSDLVFGSNSQLRALVEVYASSDSGNKFVNDFISAWNKVMNADRFDIQ